MGRRILTAAAQSRETESWRRLARLAAAGRLS